VDLVLAPGNWRVIFRIEDGEALEVNYLDYHKELSTYANEESAPSRRNHPRLVHRAVGADNYPVTPFARPEPDPSSSNIQ
jgi:hypothetical protein